MIWSSSLCRSWEFFTSPPCPDLLWGPSSLLSDGYQGSFPGGKAAGAWSWPVTSFLCRGQECFGYTSIPPVRPHWVMLIWSTGTNFTFFTVTLEINAVPGKGIGRRIYTSTHLNLGSRLRCVVSLTPLRKEPRDPLGRRLDWPKSSLDEVVRRKIPFPAENRTQVARSVVSHFPSKRGHIIVIISTHVFVS
jgi:hypothetical protein